jgi:SAM-dependent methyltransferase
MTASCRVCGATSIRTVGAVEYIERLPCEIVDCNTCGCRWTRHDATVHATLHQTTAISYYADYRALFETCRRCFAAGDRDALDRALHATPKYQFVADRLRNVGDRARVLEWGCSRGYLTAASILGGRNVLGVDVSPEAVDAARAAFGDHFALADSPRVDAHAPYDAIYHVGLIGCVEDPIGLTRRLLTLLSPGGRLFFNAPNRNAVFQRGQLWFDSAPPPEAITLFPQGFWQRQFSGMATVTETIVPTLPPESTVKTLTRWCGPSWHPPVPHSILSGTAHRWRQPDPGPIWSTVTAVAAKVSAMTGLRLGTWPEEYGFYVEMVAP